MKKIFDYYFPDWDIHFEQIMEKDPNHEYQSKQRARAISHVNERTVAIDVGGHVGLWANKLADDFQHVHSFEPVPEIRECFEQNVKKDNVTLYPFAMWDSIGVQKLLLPTKNSGAGYVEHEEMNETTKLIRNNGQVYKEIDINCRTLDSFNIQDVSFIKYDVQGCEYKALMGSVETITTFKPVLCCEITTDFRVKLLIEKLGYVFIDKIGKEHIFKWKT